MTDVSSAPRYVPVLGGDQNQRLVGIEQGNDAGKLARTKRKTGLFSGGTKIRQQNQSTINLFKQDLAETATAQRYQGIADLATKELDTLAYKGRSDQAKTLSVRTANRVIKRLNAYAKILDDIGARLKKAYPQLSSGKIDEILRNIDVEDLLKDAGVDALTWEKDPAKRAAAEQKHMTAVQKLVTERAGRYAESLVKAHHAAAQQFSPYLADRAMFESKENLRSVARPTIDAQGHGNDQAAIDNEFRNAFMENVAKQQKALQHENFAALNNALKNDPNGKGRDNFGGNTALKEALTKKGARMIGDPVGAMVGSSQGWSHQIKQELQVKFGLGDMVPAKPVDEYVPRKGLNGDSYQVPQNDQSLQPLADKWGKEPVNDLLNTAIDSQVDAHIDKWKQQNQIFREKHPKLDAYINQQWAKTVAGGDENQMSQLLQAAATDPSPRSMSQVAEFAGREIDSEVAANDLEFLLEDVQHIGDEFAALDNSIALLENLTEDELVEDKTELNRAEQRLESTMFKISDAQQKEISRKFMGNDVKKTDFGEHLSGEFKTLFDTHRQLADRIKALKAKKQQRADELHKAAEQERELKAEKLKLQEEKIKLEKEMQAAAARAEREKEETEFLDPIKRTMAKQESATQMTAETMKNAMSLVAAATSVVSLDESMKSKMVNLKQLDQAWNDLKMAQEALQMAYLQIAEVNGDPNAGPNTVIPTKWKGEVHQLIDANSHRLSRVKHPETFGQLDQTVLDHLNVVVEAQTELTDFVNNKRRTDLQTYMPRLAKSAQLFPGGKDNFDLAASDESHGVTNLDYAMLYLQKQALSIDRNAQIQDDKKNLLQGEDPRNVLVKGLGVLTDAANLRMRLDLNDFELTGDRNKLAKTRNQLRNEMTRIDEQLDTFKKLPKGKGRDRTNSYISLRDDTRRDLEASKKALAAHLKNIDKQLN